MSDEWEMMSRIEMDARHLKVGIILFEYWRKKENAHIEKGRRKFC